MILYLENIAITWNKNGIWKSSSKPVVLNLVGATGPHKFHTCIHRTLRSWKNKISFFSSSYSLKLTHRSQVKNNFSKLNNEKNN